MTQKLRMTTMHRKPAISIEKMIDEVFHDEIDDELIEELAESQTLIKKFLNDTIKDEEVWKQLAEPNQIDERKQFLSLIAITFLENDNNMLNIDLITSKHNEVME